MDHLCHWCQFYQSLVSRPDILNGTIVNCTDVGASLAETSTETVTVHIIQMADLDYSDSLLEVDTAVSNFGANNITVSLSWTQQESSVMMSYNVTVVPEVSAVKFIEEFESTAVQLILSYNIQYIVSFVGTLCGCNMSSTTVELNYVKCIDLLQMLGSGIQVIGYSDSATEGTTVILECPSPNLVHMGSNTTICMGNGEWEPDPRDVQCIESAADCGVPLTNGSVSVTYNSTLEGSVAVVLCDGFEVEAFCHRNGSWSPQLNDNVCSVAPMKTIAALSSILIITTSVVVPTVVLSILGLVIIMCICLCHKYKPLSSKASPDDKTQLGDTHDHVESSQPTQPLPGPVYETITECNTTSTTVDLEMTENVAYAPIHTLSRQT